MAGTAPTYGKGLADGEEAAREHKVVDWAGLGAAGGCLGPEVCLGVTAVGALMSPNPPPIYFQGLNNQDPTDNDYWNGYREGYDRKLRSRRAVAAFAGGAATTAVALAALVVLVGVTGAEIGPTYY